MTFAARFSPLVRRNVQHDEQQSSKTAHHHHRRSSTTSSSDGVTDAVRSTTSSWNRQDLEAILDEGNQELLQTLARFGGAIRAALDAGNGSTGSKLPPPPASEKAIQGLARARIFPWHKDENKDNMVECGICQDRLMEGVALSRLPCGHVYHINCIVPWLSRTCTCPECRYELPTNDEQYEAGRIERMKHRRTVTCSCLPCREHECFFVNSSSESNSDNSQCCSVSQVSKADDAEPAPCTA